MEEYTFPPDTKPTVYKMMDGSVRVEYEPNDEGQE